MPSPPTGHPTMRAHAVMTVTRGRSLLARIGAFFARFPRSGEGVSTEIEVKALRDHQRWLRNFAGRPVVTRQYWISENVVGERTGLVELLLCVTVEGGRMVLRSERARLCLGPVRIPLPGFMSPRIHASCWSEEGESVMRVDIQIRSPLVGDLLGYRGEVTLSSEALSEPA